MMQANKVALLFVLLAGPALAAIPQAASREELDAFGLAYDEPNPLQKIKKCESFLTRYPKSPLAEKVWQLEFDAFLLRGDSAAALRVGQTIIELDPHQAETLARLSVLALRSRDSVVRERTKVYASHALAELAAMHRPEEMSRARYVDWKRETAAYAHASLGELALSRDDAPGAVREFETAKSLVPANTEYGELLGIAQFSKRNFKASEATLEASTTQNPLTRRASLCLMRDYVALDSLNLQIAERVASLYPHDAELQFEIGQAALDHIRNLARQANSLGRQSREFQDLEARKQGKLSEGPVSPLAAEYALTASLVSRCYQAVMEESPDSSYGHRVRGYLAEAQNEVDEALTQYRAGKDYFAAGRLLAQNTRYEQAATDFKTELSLRPDNHLALAQLSQLYVQLDKVALARPILDQLLLLYPGDAYAWLDKGRIEQKSGQWQEAAVSFKKALSIDPSLTQARYRLATVYLRLGENAAAGNELQRFRAGQEKKR